MGFSDFLLTTLERDDPRWADADEIRKAAERAMHLTRQLLGFGRQQLVARHVLSLNEVVSGMERMLRPLLGEDIRLVTQLSVGLGGVEADYGQLEQVVMNLALNARDAMRGGGRLTIETLDVDLPEGYAYRHVGIDIPAGPYVMLVVSDTGHGMTPEVKARLFEPFFTTKPATQNTGLGLATVYGIVVQSGGYIWVDSEPEKGTAFKICFPRVEAGETIRLAAQLRPARATGRLGDHSAGGRRGHGAHRGSPGPAEPRLPGPRRLQRPGGAGPGRSRWMEHRSGPHRRRDARHGRSGTGRAPGERWPGNEGGVHVGIRGRRQEPPPATRSPNLAAAETLFGR